MNFEFWTSKTYLQWRLWMYLDRRSMVVVFATIHLNSSPSNLGYGLAILAQTLKTMAAAVQIQLDTAPMLTDRWLYRETSVRNKNKKRTKQIHINIHRIGRYALQHITD